MVREYKCPGCGAPMVFDSTRQQMLCEHCNTVRTVEEMEALEAENREETVMSEDDAEAEYETGREASLKRYTCSNCGAEILTDDYTAATFCSFCGSPTLMEDRLSGAVMPSRVIPFKINKEQARSSYLAWCRKGIFTPKDFTSQSTIEKITGMYVPFWLYDYHAGAQLAANCTRVKSERRGNMEYTHTDHYRVYRDVSNYYEKVPVDASEKMPDDVMDKLEPFAYGDLTEFNMGYLSGYMAEKYNYTSDELKKRVENRVKNYINGEVRATISGYSTTAITQSRVNLNCKRAVYAMLPVWILNYRYKGKEYMFALNGQTGKIVGSLPRSAGKMLAWFAGITAGVYLLLTIAGGLL